MSKRNDAGWYPIPSLGPEIKFPSVTKILGNLAKYHLVDWSGKIDVACFKKMILNLLEAGARTDEIAANLDAIEGVSASYHKEISHEAMDYGSRVHAALDTYHKTGAYPIDPTIRPAFEACIEEECGAGIRVIESEFMVYSEIYRYAGTMDVHCYKGNMADEGIQDYKTYGGKKPVVYIDHLLQLSAYTFALETTLGKYLDFADLVYLSRDTGLPTRKSFRRTSLILPFQKFLCLCEYFHLGEIKIK